MNSYGILIVHSHRAFDAERQKENNIVFVAHWAIDENLWYIISCESEEDRIYTLKLLEDIEDKRAQYALGFAHGRKSLLKSTEEK